MDAFEIQVYDGTALHARGVGVELHSNAVARGQTHFTLEPAVGVFSWWEMGAYFQTAFTPDGTFRYAGTKLRSKFVAPSWHGFRIGLNSEFAILPERFDPERWGVEVRPIVAFENEHAAIAVNPNIDFAKNGATFQPAATALLKLQKKAAIGLEYYASFEERQQHYLFPVVNVLAFPRVEINLGFGAGLTPKSERFIAKMILGYAWE